MMAHRLKRDKQYFQSLGADETAWAFSPETAEAAAQWRQSTCRIHSMVKIPLLGKVELLY
jgi:hypothetical protein